MSRTNIYRALSFDVLHTLWLGIWGGHFWGLLKSIINISDLRTLNQRYVHDNISALSLTDFGRGNELAAFPGLVKFKDGIADVTFSDGKKYFAILQVFYARSLCSLVTHFDTAANSSDGLRSCALKI